MTSLLGITYVPNEKVPLSDLDDYVTVRVPCAQFDQHLGNHTPGFWSIDRSANDGADFKQGKYVYWTRRLSSNEPVAFPVLTGASEEEGWISIMDGRHRIMAIIDSGREFFAARIQKSLLEKAQVAISAQEIAEK